MPLLWGDDPNVEAVLDSSAARALGLEWLELWDELELDGRTRFATSFVDDLEKQRRRLDLPADAVPDVARTADAFLAWLSDPTVRTGFLEAIARRREAPQ